MIRFLSLLLGCSMLAGCQTAFPPLPDREGFAGGYAGVAGGSLYFAGGANFPEKKPWEGGKKVWYDTIYRIPLDADASAQADQQWEVVGKLPRPLGYGVSLTTVRGVICAGGSDVNRHYADVFCMAWHPKLGFRIEPLPPLPQPVANACGAVIGNSVFVMGGLAAPDSAGTLASVYELNLDRIEAGWQTRTALPSPRMLATAASLDGKLYVVGGVDLRPGPDGKPQRVYLNDAWRLDPKVGWQRIADMPSPRVAAPSPACVDVAGFYILGGDDGTQVGVSPEKHRGFNSTVLRYDVATNRWSAAGAFPSAQVTTTAVFWNGTWIVPSGEIRPGIRTPAVTTFVPPAAR